MAVTGKQRKLHLVMLLMYMRRRSWLMESSSHVMNSSIRQSIIADCKQNVRVSDSRNYRM
jgi:hypothetical protein